MSAMTLVKAFFDMYQDHFIEKTGWDSRGTPGKPPGSRRKARSPAGKQAKM